MADLISLKSWYGDFQTMWLDCELEGTTIVVWRENNLREPQPVTLILIGYTQLDNDILLHTTNANPFEGDDGTLDTRIEYFGVGFILLSTIIKDWGFSVPGNISTVNKT